jgi:4a-hydroxytetrahydrobiopterin dehydratase
MACTRLTAAEFAALDGLDDWRYLLDEIQAAFRLPSYAPAVELTSAVARAAVSLDRLPGIDLRPPDRLRVVLATPQVGVTERDVELARLVSGLARESDAVAEPLVVASCEIGIDALDIAAVRPFWTAVLGYRDVDGYLVDPAGRGPAVWFQQMDRPRPQRNRVHLDITVPHDVADRRLAAALAAGGRLVSDARARAFWVLADPEGNEACVCTWQDRG